MWGKRNKQKIPTHSSWYWGPEQQLAFNNLKTALSSPPVLGYADYNLPFELNTDASREGLGAVLYQEHDGIKYFIAYASKGLNKAVKWAVTEKFHDYLFGNKFTALTDNNPLTYVLITAKLDATGHRWLAALAS